MNYQLLNLLENVLGTSYKTSKSNYKFYSPFIVHHKPKLEIDLNTTINGENKWHCWVSNKGGTSIRSLFKQINQITPLSNNHWILLNELIKNNNSNYNSNIHISNLITPSSDWIPLWCYDEIDDYNYNNIISYLTNVRKLSTDDIIKYNIMGVFNHSSKYYNNILFPSYDQDNNLNYYIYHNYKFRRYTLPSIPKTIFYDSMIDYTQPVYLVEGVYDGIRMKRNTIPLLGKTITDELLNRFVTYNTPLVNICLDQEKFAINSSIKISEKLIKLRIPSKIYLWEDVKKDPGDLGLCNIKKSSIVKDYSLLKDKLYIRRIMNERN